MKTMNEHEWQDMLDAVDPFFGDERKLVQLVQLAPDNERRRCLLRQIADNRRFIACLQPADGRDLHSFLSEADKKLVACGRWSRRIIALENSDTPGWRPGWTVQLRLYPPTGKLETVCQPRRFTDKR